MTVEVEENIIARTKINETEWICEKCDQLNFIEYD